MDKQTLSSNYWLDVVAREIIQQYPEGKIIVSSGHSPSGKYHIGTLRELITASAILQVLSEQGQEAQHIDFIDDFDILRKIPEGLPDDFRHHLGKPLYLAPSPIDGHNSYADYYLHELQEACQQLGITPLIYRSHQEYQAGNFTFHIERVLERLSEVREIIQTVSGRQLASDWAPVQLLSDDNYLNKWSYKGWDKSRQVIFYSSEGGVDGELSYLNGKVKLDWRLDWPARWHKYGVNVEPFGRDHATKGGSYDTGKELVEKVFGSQAPYPVPYEFINVVGQTKKMSKSAGNVITPLEAMDVMPAEILRYFVLKSRFTKTLIFDTGLALYNLVDEFTQAYEAISSHQEHDFARAVHVALNGAGRQGLVISSVPFNHLVTAYQTALGNFDEVLKILERTNWRPENDNEKAVIKRELEFVANWLKKYAPDSVKFELQKQLPAVELSEKQKHFLALLADKVAAAKNIDGQQMHEAIYTAKDEAEITPAEAFQAVYRVLLNQDSGPKAGWFLASLDKKWLVKRLRFEV